jgi:DNA-binding LytR/AlgR family response regulator
MPDLSGFEFIETLKSSPSVILSTAYENYALESYRFNISDYLLKPYSFGRFLKAVEKALGQINNGKNDIDKPYITNNKLFVNLGGRIVGLNFEDIHFIKGESDYIEIKTSEKSFLVRDNLKKVQPMLEDFGFQRIHRSYIISLNKINSLENDTVEISKEKLPIGRSYKKLLLDSINRYRIG